MRMVIEEEIWECFEVCQEIEGCEDVVVFMVKSRQYPFKFVLKRFPRHKLGLFQQERGINAKIPKSPYFPEFYESFITLDTKIGFLIMEWIDGKDLDYVIFDLFGDDNGNKNLVPFKWYLHESMAFIAAELAVAIQILHDAKIVHRDIKPGNVIIDRNGHLKLFDFGFSIQLDSLDTRMNDGVGTPSFMAPEMADYDYNYQVDWYCYGTAISCLVGDHVADDEVFYEKRDSIFEELKKILNDNEFRLIDFCTLHDINHRIKSLEQLKGFAIFENINWDEMKRRIAQPPGIFFFFNL